MSCRKVFAMLLPAFRGVAAVRGIEGLTNPRGFILVDKHQRNPAFPEIFAVGVCVAIPPIGKTPVPVGVPKTGFMIESMVTATARNIERLIAGQKPDAAGDLERGLPRRFRRFRHRLRRAAADPAAQRQLVVVGQMGAHRQGRLREVLPAQGPLGKVRAVLRAPRAAGARHRQAEGGQGRVRTGRLILPAG